MEDTLCPGPTHPRGAPHRCVRILGDMVSLRNDQYEDLEGQGFLSRRIFPVPSIESS